jgi:hypothetical protein
VQIPVPPLPPGFVPPPLGIFEFVLFYIALLESVLLLLPRKVGKQILETLFPGLAQAVRRRGQQ